MPLCHTEQEQVAADDLIEYMEIEKSDMGRPFVSIHLLMLTTALNLYLLFLEMKMFMLLSYRFFITSLANFDVPKLIAPVAFKYASLSLRLHARK